MTSTPTQGVDWDMDCWDYVGVARSLPFPARIGILGNSRTLAASMIDLSAADIRWVLMTNR